MSVRGMRAIAVDVGGHGAKANIVVGGSGVEGPAVIHRYPSAVRDPGIDKRNVPGDERVEAVVQAINELRKRDRSIKHFGIATTGTVDITTGTIIRDQAATYQGTNWPRRLLAAGAIGPDDLVYVQNDAKAGAWAEYRLWQSHPKSAVCPSPTTLVRVTIGSGVGSAIVHAGNLLLGAGSVAGEFTYMPFRPAQELAGFIPEVACGDGRLGCTESYAASPGILRGARKAASDRKTAWARAIRNPDGLDMNDVVAGLNAKDPGVVGTVKLAAAALGSALLNIIYLLGPDVVVLSGGVPELLRPHYIDFALDYVSKNGVIRPALAAANIVEAQFASDNAAVIGVAHLVLEQGRMAKEIAS